MCIFSFWGWGFRVESQKWWHLTAFWQPETRFTSKLCEGSPLLRFTSKPQTYPTRKTLWGVTVFAIQPSTLNKKQQNSIRFFAFFGERWILWNYRRSKVCEGSPFLPSTLNPEPRNAVGVVKFGNGLLFLSKLTWLSFKSEFTSPEMRQACSIWECRVTAFQSARK